MSTKKSGQSRLRAVQESNFYQQKEIVPEIKDIKSLKIELHLWNQTYNEIVEIFSDIVSFSKEKTKNSQDKQSSLLGLCREVAKIAKDPKRSNEYQSLLKKFQECQNKLADLSQKNAALVNDTYTFSSNNNYDVIQSEKSQISIRLNNLDNLLSREIEENKKYLPNYTPNVPNLDTAVNDPLPLSKKPSTIISSPQKKRVKSVFPSVSELLSSSFHKKTKNDIFQMVSDNVDNQKSIDLIEYNKNDISVVTANPPTVPLDQGNQNDHQKTSKSQLVSNDEIPFGKRSVSKNSRIRSKTKK